MKQIKFAYFDTSESISATKKVLVWFGFFGFKLFYFTISSLFYYHYYYDSFMEKY